MDTIRYVLLSLVVLCTVAEVISYEKGTFYFLAMGILLLVDEIGKK
jgi:hypothetical protein